MNNGVVQRLVDCKNVEAMKDLMPKIRSEIAGKRKIVSADIDEFLGLIRRRDRKKMQAFGFYLALIDANELISRVRRSGAFRASRYDFKDVGLSQLIVGLIDLHSCLEITQVQLCYLESVRNLHVLSSHARKLRDATITRLKSRRGMALKSHVSRLNQLFLNYREPDNRLGSESLDSYSVEAIAEAVSRLFEIHKKELGLTTADVSLTDVRARDRLSPAYERELLDVLHIEELMKAEILIDGLPYRADIDSGNIIIRSIDPCFEMATRFGYIQTAAQIQVRQRSMLELWGELGPVPELKDVIGSNGELFSHIAKVIRKPVPRVVMFLPTQIEGFFDFLARDALYQEEWLMLMQLDVEKYGNSEDPVFSIIDGISSTDIFKVMRVFSFFNHLVDLAIAAEPEEMRAAIAQSSSAPLMKRADLISYVSLAVGVEKAEKIVDLLTARPGDSYFDLQYKPFVLIDGLYFVSPVIVAKSNIARSIVRANSLESPISSGNDEMQNAVADAFRSAGFAVGVEVESSKQKKMPEFDIVAFRDGVLYVLECKSSYHPVNSHELRNSYYHIETAGRQLSKRLAWASDRGNIEKLWSVLGWGFDPNVEVRTAVVMANRVLSGIEVGGHPVRQAHELINVLLNGTMEAPGVKLNFWKGDAFSNADLNSYLGPDGLIGDQFSAMMPVTYSTNFGDRSLVVESYALSPEDLHSTYKSRYRNSLCAPLGGECPKTDG